MKHFLENILAPKGITQDNWYDLDLPMRHYFIENFFSYLNESGEDFGADDNILFSLAAENGHTEIVEFLIEMGYRPSRAKSALVLAATNGHLDIVNTLLDSKIEWVPPERYNPRHYHDIWIPKIYSEALISAVKNGHREIVERLLSESEVLQKGGVAQAVVEAAFKDEQIQLLKDMLKKDLVPSKLVWEKALRAGSVEIVKLLLETQFHNNTDLFIAIEGDNPKVLKLLLDAGGNVHYDNEAFLTSASQSNKPQMVKVLLEAGADPNKIDDTVISESPEVMNLLFAAGMSKSKEFYLEDNNEILITALLYGADPSKFDENEITTFLKSGEGTLTEEICNAGWKAQQRIYDLMDDDDFFYGVVKFKLLKYGFSPSNEFVEEKVKVLKKMIIDVLNKTKVQRRFNEVCHEYGRKQYIEPLKQDAWNRSDELLPKFSSSEVEFESFPKLSSSEFESF